MKLFNLFLGILFIVFAIVQYNDPDPWLWITLYTAIGVISLFAAAKRYNRIVLIIGMVICLIWMFFLVPGFIDWINKGMPTIAGSMKAEAPHIELTREFLGLFIAGAALFFHYIQLKK